MQEKFVVSAIKYRPSTFDSVVGQAHISTTLKNAIANNHLAHAFLFCGPRGVGKTTCARILAKTINCQNLSPDIEPCNQCESCTAFNNNASFNIHELDAASNNSVEDIRSLVEQVRYPPQSGKYKIYIIDEVHMLSNQAFNAFLKTLEEPPSYAKFILATTEKHKIIPTILSRCQIFDFNRIQLSDIVGHLQRVASKEGIEAEESALHLIARKADGGMRDALSIFDLIATFGGGKLISYKNAIDNLHILDYDTYFHLTDKLLAQDIAGALVDFDHILRQGFDAHLFVVGLAGHFRDLMVCKDEKTVKLLEVPEATRQRYIEQARACQVSFLLTALNLASQADIQFKSSKNQRLLVELALMKISHIPSAMAVTVAAHNEADEKKNASRVGESPAEAVSTDSPAKATPVAEKPAASPGKTLGGSFGAIPKLSDLGQKGAPSVPARPSPSDSSQVEEATSPSATPLVAISDEWLQNQTQAYAQRKQAEGDDPAFAILDQKLVRVGESGEVVFPLRSKLEGVQFERLQSAYVQYLRQQSGNAKLLVRTEVVAQASSGLELHTDSERWAHLSQEFPLLNDLKRELGLEL